MSLVRRRILAISSISEFTSAFTADAGLYSPPLTHHLGPVPLFFRTTWWGRDHLQNWEDA